MINQYDIIIDQNKLAALRLDKSYPGDGDDINDPRSIVSYFRYIIGITSDANESAWVVSCDQWDSVIGICRVSIGDEESCMFNRRTVGMFLLLSGGEKAYFIHNHPREKKCRASNEDKVVAIEMQALCNLIEIKFGAYFAMSEDDYVDCLTDENGDYDEFFDEEAANL